MQTSGWSILHDVEQHLHDLRIHRETHTCTEGIGGICQSIRPHNQIHSRRHTQVHTERTTSPTLSRRPAPSLLQSLIHDTDHVH
jgi:hypothetical protein